MSDAPIKRGIRGRGPATLAETRGKPANTVRKIREPNAGYRMLEYTPLRELLVPVISARYVADTDEGPLVLTKSELAQETCDAHYLKIEDIAGIYNHRLPIGTDPKNRLTPNAVNTILDGKVVKSLGEKYRRILPEILKIILADDISEETRQELYERGLLKNIENSDGTQAIETVTAAANRIFGDMVQEYQAGPSTYNFQLATNLAKAKKNVGGTEAGRSRVT